MSKITCDLDPAIAAELERLQVNVPEWLHRAAWSYLRQCRDAAAVLRTLSRLQGGPVTSEERWATQLEAREPAVRAMIGRTTTGGKTT